jgi:hypothetical protein
MEELSMKIDDRFEKIKLIAGATYSKKINLGLKSDRRTP